MRKIIMICYCEDLLPGLEFKLQGKRKWETVVKVQELKHNPGFVPLEHDGKILVVMKGCGQYTLPKHTRVILNQHCPAYITLINEIKIQTQ